MALHIRQKTARSGSSGLTAGSGGETWHPRAVIPVGIKPTDFGIATWVTKPAIISWRPAAPLPRSAALIAMRSYDFGQISAETYCVLIRDSFSWPRRELSSAVARPNLNTCLGIRPKNPPVIGYGRSRDHAFILLDACLSMLRPHRETLNQFRPSVPVWSETLWQTFVRHVAISA